jgi:alkylation response protein AidB-like acyl-CoA dehydrogenase
MTVTFALSAQQRQLKGAVRQFANDHIAELAAAVRAEPDPSRRAALARPYYEKAVAAGFLRGVIPADFGGNATNGVDAAIFIEEMAAVSPDFLISLAGPLIALSPVYEVGTPEQIERFVSPFLTDSGAPLAAMAYSEPGGSANFDAPPPAEGTRTTAVLEGDHWVINGRKAWSSHLGGWDGHGPDLMMIVCRTPMGVSLIAAEREHLQDGLTVEEVFDLPGLRGCLTSRVRLDNVRVPQSNLIGPEGQGAPLTRNAFLASGAATGVLAVAAMRNAFDIAYRFATTEKRGGPVPIIDHQAVADVLADAKGKIEATRLLCWRALDALMSRDPAGPELALHAKIFGSETGFDVVSSLIKMVGVESYNHGFPIFEQLTNALAYPVIEGSNIGVRRRQLQDLMRTSGWNPLLASGLNDA